MSEHAHDAHHAHKSSPVAASIVALLIAAIFGVVFALLTGGSISTGVIVAFVLLLVHGLVMIWVTDNKE